MRYSRSLTRSEQGELLVLLGVVVLGLLALTVVWRTGTLHGVFAFATTSGMEPKRAATAETPPVVEVESPQPVAGPDAMRMEPDAKGANEAVAATNKASSRTNVPKVASISEKSSIKTAEPTSKIRKSPEMVSHKGEKYRYIKTLRMRVTAYAPDPRCCWPYAGTTTASGLSVKTNGGRLVAADTRILPFHSLVSIPGYHASQPVPVLDRGGAIKGQRLDVLLPTFSAAKKWGSRYVDVKVYAPVNDN